MSSIQRSGSFENIDWDSMLSHFNNLKSSTSVQKIQSTTLPIVSPGSSAAVSEVTTREESVSPVQKRSVTTDSKQSEAKRTRLSKDVYSHHAVAQEIQTDGKTQRDSVAERIVELSLFWAGKQELPRRYRYELNSSQNSIQIEDPVSVQSTERKREKIERMSSLPELFDL